MTLPGVRRLHLGRIRYDLYYLLVEAPILVDLERSISLLAEMNIRQLHESVDHLSPFPCPLMAGSKHVAPTATISRTRGNDLTGPRNPEGDRTEQRERYLPTPWPDLTQRDEARA